MRNLSTPPPPHIPDHEILRLIGRGGYGEVWLAHNVVGTMRAIKIVYGNTFEHRRPYEREFEGIKRYEPISRTHESQVAILHVGRHEQDEYYYYIMELADDANAIPDRTNDPSLDRTRETEKPADAIRQWATYRARTLQTELKQRGKLPLAECIDLAISLGTALHHLHKHGLVHRDIKPGNVIFINGIPKLADIGLVAEKDSTVSFVGTRGYLPPEGPGTARADIFSLGKVLYEISTGKDRNEFPALSLDPDDSTRENQFLEFNEILLKACHGNWHRRYASIGELLDDLSLLQKGRSVRQKRARQRWLGITRKAAALAGIVLCLGAIGYLLGHKPAEAENLDPLPLRVENAEFWRTENYPRKFDFSPAGDSVRIVFSGEKGISIWDRNREKNERLRLTGLEDWILDGNKTLTRIWAAPASQMDQADEVVRGRQPLLSPDGQTIYFVGERADQGGIFAIDRRSRSTPRRIANLTPFSTAGIYQPYNLSPDGTQIAFFGYDETHAARYGVFVVPTGGGKAVMYADVNEWVSIVPVWSPDGRQFYFNSDECQGGKKHLHIYDLETKQITHAVRNGWLPRWSGDGTTAVWAHWKDLRYFELWENFQ